jgi:hypothetical protein
LKGRLPVLGAPATRAVRPMRESAGPEARVRVARPLICVASDSESAVRFTSGLVAGLRQHGCATAVLLAAPAASVHRGDATESLASRLRDAGATRVLVVPAKALPDAGMRALESLSGVALTVALGSALARHLQGTLTITIGSVGRGDPSSGVDLALVDRGDDLSVLLSAWLAARLASRSDAIAPP